MQTIHETIDQLHDALAEYIEATYHISAPTLIKQRQALLAKPKVIHQVPYLESTPRYQTGERFEAMSGLHEAALEVYQLLSHPQGCLPRLLYDPPYRHQSEAIENTLIDNKNLVVMTGTGSGKTESFLLPILGKLAREAKDNPEVFSSQPAMRALILYPMNALVNDQLGRLRALFGDPRLVGLFKTWAGRPPRFARYTSRTPYAGVREPRKDSQKLAGFNHFFVEIQQAAEHGSDKEKAEAQRLLRQLKDKGKWPAKPDLAAWFLGKKGRFWKDSKTGEYIRGITLPDDSELLTRHEIQTAPPDLLVTNYSMLEYMLMRPIERPIFDATRDWLARNPHQSFLLILDEAHLYRGAAGAEVGLLLRRLRDRLDIPPERFQIVCATASFRDAAYAPDFGAQISGVPAETFVPITGTLDLRAHASKASAQDAEILADIDLNEFYAAPTPEARFKAVQSLLDYRQVDRKSDVESSLHAALKDFAPMGLLINTTMKKACAIAELSKEIFPTAEGRVADTALTVLMALGSIAREEPNTPGLLPCRIHNFFRGLPGLWVCMDPDCTELAEDCKDEICGKMYSQPREFCDCGARVLEFFTCRNCGTAYARAYTDDIDTPTTLWSEPGRRLRISDHETSPLYALDLLLEEPGKDELAELADLDLETGRVNPQVAGPRMRSVYLAGKRSDPVGGDSNSEDGEDVESDAATRGQFVPCAVCEKSARFGRTYVQDHQTKGDEPFQALVSRQILIQPPGPVEANNFAPLQGRKVLTFSDSRQVAARLAPNLQNYSVRDSLRPLILYGFNRLHGVPALQSILSLEDLYLAVLLASQELGVRLRPELKSGETFFGALEKVQNALQEPVTDAKLLTLCIEMRSESAPEALLENILRTILDDRFLGLEALALATVVERSAHTAALEKLVDIPGVAETGMAKREFARAWLRCWQGSGFWVSSMPLTWANRPRSEGMSILARKGKFRVMNRILVNSGARKIFNKEWLPELLRLFAQPPDSDHKRLRGSELSLSIQGGWTRCLNCKSVHRPVSGIGHCLDCGSNNVIALDPDTDPVFLARKGYYRKPAVAALATPPSQPMALIAAEHTAQLNAPQNEDIFSKAEENELLFQDVELAWGAQSRSATAIDVLSSTTTMEVGIDLGALSGVALRNMPPARANYQQRAGRAGRRGNAIATVIAFGSADTHDEHYFIEPDGMIRGDVVDPRLTLGNKDIVRRHIRAFLLQNYHQDRLPEVDDTQRHDLFSVLGTVSEFRSGEGLLSRDDFATWLEENESRLRDQVKKWIPDALLPDDKTELLIRMREDCLAAIDDAIGYVEEEERSSEDEDRGAEEVTEAGDENQKLNITTLLDRLLYCGKLPRYAFPTDVATFYVFDRDRSTPFRPVMRFAPQQGLAIALSQYAPGKQVWIAGKCYTSGAIYSAVTGDRFKAWKARRRYLECSRCGFAKTEDTESVDLGDVQDCPACLSQSTFGPARNWIRPPGFAHPEDMEEVISPDEIPETSYATRAKLTMESPLENQGWVKINERLRVFSIRQHLLISNSGPQKEGYSYCTKCGRIEAHIVPQPTLLDSHRKPFPARDTEKICEGQRLARNLVLGTDFITDIALFSLHVAPPIRLTPGHYTTDVALRTVSEALAKAACQMLEIEPAELLAEYRPALTQPGAEGLEAEIFLYDTLPGGAGFSSQLPACGKELFQRALDLIKTCPEDCDASCYRCLRSFKNKFEHSLLDRHVGTELLEYLITGQLQSFNARRLAKSTDLLLADLQRTADDLKFEKNVEIEIPGSGKFAAPIYLKEKEIQFTVFVTGPLEIDQPGDPLIKKVFDQQEPCIIIPVNELAIRENLANETSEVLSQITRLIQTGV